MTVRHFDGRTFDLERDGRRLTTQWERVRDLMLDGQWRTLHQIAQALDVPEASASARLRDLRKPRFGGYRVEHENHGGGTWRYRVLVDPLVRVETLERVSPRPVVLSAPDGAHPQCAIFTYEEAV